MDIGEQILEKLDKRYQAMKNYRAKDPDFGTACELLAAIYCQCKTLVEEILEEIEDERGDEGGA